MSMDRSNFGTTRDGQRVDLFTLTNDRGCTVRITNYGGRITQWLVPDKHGERANVTLGFDNLEQYLGDNPYFGALIGRVANRIAGGRFELDGKTYQIPTNNGPNALHGGPTGFDRRVWTIEEAGTTLEPDDGRGGDSLVLSYLSPDGEEGFPGTVRCRVIYRLLSADNVLRIEYHATSDRATPINLTNHAYFNLRGAGNGTVLDHIVKLDANHFTPVDSNLIPTGDIAAVAHTPMDFWSKEHRIGERIAQVPGGPPGGYDHNYVLNHDAGVRATAPSARVREPESGRVLEVFTSQPGMQLYTGNFLDGNVRGIGGAYVKHGAFCLETQDFPDAVNRPNFPSTILRPGEAYSHATEYRFSIEE